MQELIDQITLYGIKDKKILDAMKNIDRKHFVPTELSDMAYTDTPLPIGHDQTISQPYTVALMLDALELGEGLNILEIGTGSGWNAALIKHIVGTGRVTSVEYVKDLAQLSVKNIGRSGMNVKVIHGDASIGYAPNAPYDRIIATCAAPCIIDQWKKQLKPGGIIVAPVGRYFQKIVKWQNDKETSSGDFAFVKLKGNLGFKN